MSGSAITPSDEEGGSGARGEQQAWPIMRGIVGWVLRDAARQRLLRAEAADLHGDVGEGCEGDVERKFVGAEVSGQAPQR